MDVSVLWLNNAVYFNFFFNFNILLRYLLLKQWPEITVWEVKILMNVFIDYF